MGETKYGPVGFIVDVLWFLAAVLFYVTFPITFPFLLVVAHVLDWLYPLPPNPRGQVIEWDEYWIPIRRDVKTNWQKEGF